MKKLMTAAVILTAIVCANANAASVATHKVTDAQFRQAGSLWFAQDDGKIGRQEYERRLKECSNSGNLMCSSLLGLTYYDADKYKEAYALLMKSQGIIQDSDGDRYAPSELALGQMFRFGIGVMKSDDKAIEHYRVGATLGDKDCVIGMFSSYLGKFKSAQRDSPAYKSAIKNAYAWTKVAQGLGMDSYKNIDGENEIINVKVPKIRKAMIGVYGESFANDADDRASEICSKVTGCIQ